MQGELFYRNGVNDMIRVTYTATPTFSLRSQTELFPTNPYAASSWYKTYDVTPDDQRFVMIRYGPWQNGELIVIENAFNESQTTNTQ